MAFLKKKKKKAVTLQADPDISFGAAGLDEVPAEKVTAAAAPEAIPRSRVSLERRKLTKKQQGQIAAKYHRSDIGNVLDKYISGMVDDARTKFGAPDKVMTANDTNNLLIGIPCPSLAFEYLIAQDVFPLGLIIHLVGPPATNKSALLFEIMRWFILAGGIANLFEVESKLSPDWLPSIVGRENTKRIAIDFCDSVEDWQRHLLHWMGEHKRLMIGTKADPGPGRTIPVLLGVDSIMGKPAIETQERVNEQGFGSRAYPVEAAAITQWIKTVPHQFNTWPFTVILNNHLKMGKDENGNDERKTGGGKGTNFQESFELETKVRKSKIYCAAWDGKVIAIKCHKNSFGPTFREIDTRVLWWDEEDPDNPGQVRQKTVFDWHWATISMLNKLQGREAQALKAVFHLAVVKSADVENSAWSRSLGMKSAEEAVSWSELGERIAQNADVLAAIRRAIGIKRRPLLEGDYLNQLQELVATEVR